MPPTHISHWRLLLPVTCHKVIRREIDEEGYNWDAGPPKYEHFHYAEDGEVDFAPRIIGGTPAFHGEFVAKVRKYYTDITFYKLFAK